MPIGPGTRLGQYDVLDFIGQGAMGLVYRAYHAQLERTGAVKVMQAISPDADTVARFRHEAQAIAQLRHPNIIDVYDFGEYQGTPYMVVEYIPGGSLATKMNQGGIARATALHYLHGIAAGLDYAHQHGVVHRDVKPANVLLTAEDTPVIADFGLAKLLQGSSLKSMTGVTTGTPAYMAPEQVAGHQVSPAADRYSLATIAYEMLTGVIPFESEALMELLYAQVHREPLVPSARKLALGPQVDAVIMRGLAKDPAARWESCTAFVDALGDAMTGTPAPVAAKTMVMEPPVLASTVPLAPAPVAVRARPVPGTVAMAYPAPAAAAPPKAKRHPRWGLRALIGTAAVIALLLVLGVCQLAAGATTLALNPTIAAPGESVNVTATRVPANQVGLIELHSLVRTYPFKADSSARVNTYINVPREIQLGDHTVGICWNGSCRASATLKIASGVAIASPAADSSPGRTQTPIGSPSPGASPPEGATPHPTSTPHTPTPTPNPCPTPPTPAKLNANPTTVLLNSPVTITGQSFDPNQPVAINYYLGSTQKRTFYERADCLGSFSFSFTPATSTLDLGTGRVVATDGLGRSASATFTVAL